MFVDTEENKLEEKTVEEEPKTADVEPLIINDVSASVSAVKIPENEEFVEEEEDVISPQPVVNKPVYGAGSKHDAMFVYEEDQDFEDEVEIEPEYQQPVLEDQSQSIIYTPEQQVASEVYTEEQQSGFIDDGEVIYDGYEDDIFYDEDYDPEEAAYQAGDDGYAEYK